jgi:hypothetical protein
MSRLTLSMRVSFARSNSVPLAMSSLPPVRRYAIRIPSTSPVASAITAAIAAPAMPVSNTSTSSAVAPALTRLIAICVASASLARAWPISQPSTT